MSSSKRDPTCPYCSRSMQTTRMKCLHCDCSVEALFADRPISRLPAEHQRFIELFVLAGGSLKEIAAQAGVSYPTVRSRLDKVIAQLRDEMQQEATKTTSAADDGQASEILKRI